MTPLALLLFGACTTPKPSDSPVDSVRDSAESGAPDSHDSDSGDSAETAPPDSAETAPPDSGDSDDPGPVFSCPGAPDGAVVLEANGYLGSVMVFNYPSQYRGWWLHFTAVSYTPDRCYDADTFYGPAWYGHGAGDFAVDIDITAPLAYPGDHQGAYPDDAAARWSSDRVAFAATFWRGDGMVVTDWPTRTSEPYDGDGDLCLSAIRPDRVAGTLLYRADPKDPDGAPTFFLEFDLRAGDSTDAATFDDGTCLFAGYHGLDEEQVWSRDWWAGEEGQEQARRARQAPSASPALQPPPRPPRSLR